LITVGDDTAQVRAAAAELQPIVLVKENAAWKIDLRQSVPAKTRRSLYEVYRRARRAERQAP
jgi:small-conductance mechanosensitive channel